MKHRKLLACLLAGSIAFTGFAHAASPQQVTYDITESYAAGTVVVYLDKAYKAKWWANPGQSPAEVDTAANAWDSPWEHTDDMSEPPVEPPVPPVEPELPGDNVLPPVHIPLSQLLDEETALTSDPLMAEVKRSIATRDNALVAKIEPGAADNPENVKRVESIITAEKWEYIFPQRAPEYTYTGFLKAIGKFSAFCAEYKDGRDSDAICRKSLATMFAHFTQETGGHNGEQAGVPDWRQGLVWVREMGWTETMRNGYNGECLPSTWQGQAWPCGTFIEDGAFKSYFGRGAKQLSYNYNYGPFSDAIYGDVRPLLDRPDLVADTWLNLASAVFFYVYPQPPKPSMLHVIDGTWQPNDRDLANGLKHGFGVTTQIINGGVECGGSGENAQSVNRIAYYRQFARELGVPIEESEVLGCAGMKQFDEQGAGALPIYWEMDWSWSAGTVGGLSYQCQLVGYQTAHNAFRQGDYAQCVQAKFPNVIIDKDK